LDYEATFWKVRS